MENPDSILRHEALNIITLVNFLVVDTNLPQPKKVEILEHLKMLGLIYAERDLIVGKDRPVFNQSIDLSEILEILKETLKKPFEKNGVTLQIDSLDLNIKADFEIVKSGLEQILGQLIQISSDISITSTRPSSVIITYRSDKVLEPPTLTLIDCFKNKLKYSDIFLKLALSLMESNGIKVHFNTNQVRVEF